MEEDRPVYVTVENTISGISRHVEVGSWKALWRPGISIGTSPDCTIVIDPDVVGPTHATVRGRGHHLVVEVVEGAVEFLGREVAKGRMDRINGLGAPVGFIGIGPIRVYISIVKPWTREDLRPWWKFW